MRVLVIGGTGLLGSDVVREAERRSWEVAAPSSRELDLTDPMSLAQIPFGEFGSFDYCVNCGGYTAVDRAETEVRAATELNALGPGYLALACAQADCELIHISTDFVFDGQANVPYVEEDATDPISVYGATKLAGETAVLSSNLGAVILRTSWLYGPNGHCFPNTILHAAQSGKDLRVVDDQIGTPTYTGDLASAIADAMEQKLYPGVYHASGTEAMSWYAFAERILEQWNRLAPVRLTPSITPIPSTEWPTPARRPRFSVLDNSKLRTNGIEMQTRGLTDFIARKFEPQR